MHSIWIWLTHYHPVFYLVIVLGTRNHAKCGVHVYRTQLKMYKKIQHRVLTYSLVEIYWDEDCGLMESNGASLANWFLTCRRNVFPSSLRVCDKCRMPMDHLTLKMKAKGFFETSGATYPAKQRHTPEDWDFRICRFQNTRTQLLRCNGRKIRQNNTPLIFFIS